MACGDNAGGCGERLLGVIGNGTAGFPAGGCEHAFSSTLCSLDDMMTRMRFPDDASSVMKTPATWPAQSHNDGAATQQLRNVELDHVPLHGSVIGDISSDDAWATFESSRRCAATADGHVIWDESQESKTSSLAVRSNDPTMVEAQSRLVLWVTLALANPIVPPEAEPRSVELWLHRRDARDGRVLVARSSNNTCTGTVECFPGDSFRAVVSPSSRVLDRGAGRVQLQAVGSSCPAVGDQLSGDCRPGFVLGRLGTFQWSSENVIADTWRMLETPSRPSHWTLPAGIHLVSVSAQGAPETGGAVSVQLQLKMDDKRGMNQQSLPFSAKFPKHDSCSPRELQAIGVFRTERDTACDVQVLGAGRGLGKHADITGMVTIPADWFEVDECCVLQRTMDTNDVLPGVVAWAEQQPEQSVWEQIPTNCAFQWNERLHAFEATESAKVMVCAHLSLTVTPTSPKVATLQVMCQTNDVGAGAAPKVLHSAQLHNLPSLFKGSANGTSSRALNFPLTVQALATLPESGGRIWIQFSDEGAIEKSGAWRMHSSALVCFAYKDSGSQTCNKELGRVVQAQHVRIRRLERTVAQLLATIQHQQPPQ